jgi:hypothetical protein
MKIRTLAKSMGWITTLAKVAADPPQTKGSKVLANELGALVLVAVAIVFCLFGTERRKLLGEKDT